MSEALSRTELETLSGPEIDALERKIAGKYMHRIPWGAVAWGLGNLTVWLSLWPLVLLEILPIAWAFPIAVLTVALSYLPSHEAQHSIIAREGHPLRWLNELVGHLSVIPFAQPYRVLKATHMEHHAHTNNPELDPDYAVHAKDNWDFLKNSILRRQPGGAAQQAYGAALERVGKGNLLLDALAYNFVFLAVLCAMAWTGHAIEAALLWWLPKHIAQTYIQYYLSWAPHHPGIRQERYGQTRGFMSKAGNLLSMGMQYHIVHHLYPRIPLSSTPAAFHEMKDILEIRGCDIGQWADGSR
ncbi:MAG: fatty acid desaturase [Pseudomonadales bacterium]